MTDQEREAHIKDCGRMMQKAYEQGNRQEADQWLQAQTEAVKGRSGVQVALMEGCYFDAQGAAAHAELERQAA
jgi:hypothetical protein